MLKKRILIVEDEPDIAALISNRLDHRFYEVDHVECGAEAKRKIALNRYDLVTLDIMVPEVDGLALCDYLYTHFPKTFIIIVSALGHENDRMRGYDVGADDYVAKPFSPKELASKITAKLRRSSGEVHHVKEKNRLILDEERLCIALNGFPLDLTPSEYLILSTLLKSPSMVFSRDQLAEIIYLEGQGAISSRGIDSHIAHIRKKLSISDSASSIQTVRGWGYKINEN